MKTTGTFRSRDAITPPYMVSHTTQSNRYSRMSVLTLRADLTISNASDFEYQRVFFRLKNPFLPFEPDFPGDPVQVRAPVLAHEIIGFPVAGKMDRSALLLHIMPEVETAGGVPESLAADNKEDLHEFLPDELVLIPDEMLVLPTGSCDRHGCLWMPGFSGTTIHAMRQTMSPIPRERSMTATLTSRMTVGSGSRCSPRPARTPPGILPAAARYSHFILRNLVSMIKNTGSVSYPGKKSLILTAVHGIMERAMMGTGNTNKKATFGAGCFWGVEAAFRKVSGVLDTAVGYMGGTLKNPGYEDVCSGQTGHAEVVQVTYDPEKVRYDQLLDMFWSIHDPTQLNRQGPDIGSNYRSVIFYHDAEQGKTARKSKEQVEVSGRFGFGKVVTQILPATEFYRAEEYHQRYFEKHGGGSCHI